MIEKYIFCWHLKSSLIKPTNCRMNSNLLNKSLLNEMGRSDWKIWEGLTPKKGRNDSQKGKDWPPTQKMRSTVSKNGKVWAKTRNQGVKIWKGCVETRRSPFLFIHIINTFLKEVYFDQDLWLNLKNQKGFLLRDKLKDAYIISLFKKWNWSAAF